MKIYTKTGDKGETGLWGGKRVLKSNPVVEALGAIDELNAILGMLEMRKHKIEGRKIERIQKELMVINSAIGGFEAKVPSEKWLEKEIDSMNDSLPKLVNFIIPSGQIHFARAVCRRAERRAIVIGDSGARFAARRAAQNDILKYLNRLSDYLFVLARMENFQNVTPEIIWKI